ncbi:OmpA family protein [Actinomadura syzygii]|uniref:OmpA family protein n=1 Tax=Actinomadura syzygii TaxID=1427538 RepID=A0A5D0UB10_9ACTN|nr:OmpA family protein [Actinomadura syzygii]TYC15287.1 OmpA family protein [Actinomadura syzygii]
MRRVLPLAIFLSGLLLLAGCADTDRAVSSDPPTAGPNGSPVPRTGPGYAKEGWFGTADGLHARFEVRAVERQGTKTVLRYGVTSLDSAVKSVSFGVQLLDPVGRRLYRPTGSTSGENFTPGTARDMAAEFPPLPTETQKVTVLTPGTAGEFTGIPVTTATGTPGLPSGGPPSGGLPSGPGVPPTGTGVPTWSGPPSGFTPPSGAPNGGTTTSGPSLRAEPFERAFAGAPSPVTSSPSSSPSSSSGGTPSPGTGTSPPATGANPADLYDITESQTKDVTASGSQVTFALHTDALFNGGKATLTGGAKAVLDETAQQIKAKGARTLTFEGHTDGEGDDAKNLKLSKDRAEAVMKELKARLGGGLTYTARGMGEAQPVAREGGADDAAARARNRRVEISFPVGATLPGAPGGSSSPGGSSPSTAAGTPAAFHAQDGKTVASRSAQFGSAKRRIDVKPFYRDGPYVVAVFDIVNEGPGTTPPDASYPNKDYPGGAFTAFSVQVQGGKETYRGVRVGAETGAAEGGVGAYVDPGRAVFRTAVNQPVRGFVYLPAPPGNATSVTFNAGPFGNFDKVPVS